VVDNYPRPSRWFLFFRPPHPRKPDGSFLNELPHTRVPFTPCSQLFWMGGPRKPLGHFRREDLPPPPPALFCCSFSFSRVPCHQNWFCLYFSFQKKFPPFLFLPFLSTPSNLFWVLRCLDSNSFLANCFPPLHVAVSFKIFLPFTKRKKSLLHQPSSARSPFSFFLPI